MRAGGWCGVPIASVCHQLRWVTQFLTHTVNQIPVISHLPIYGRVCDNILNLACMHVLE
jgi:hypothetical protein